MTNYLQRNIAIHRKPLDSLELPFQHLIYHSNYLHGLVVKQGLWLKNISKPRKSGQFGYDLEIKAISPHNERPLLIGVEVFMQSWGYHAETIPKYISNFEVDGLIVISKDIESSVIQIIESSGVKLSLIAKVGDFAFPQPYFPLYHLSLGDLVTDLFELEGQLNNLLNQSRKADLGKRINKI